MITLPVLLGLALGGLTVLSGAFGLRPGPGTHRKPGVASVWPSATTRRYARERRAAARVARDVAAWGGPA